ncbi:MAG: formate dehydrogenase subunit delta [bacterium]
MISIEVDGQKIIAKEGMTLLDAAAEAGIIIPSLCASKNLLPYGACRMCAVETEGKKGYIYACSAYVSEGMKIKTISEKLFSLKRTLMELYLSDHPNDCLTCPKNLDCELQKWASYFGVRKIRFRGKSHLLSEVDESNPYFRFDPSRCIVCVRCVRACGEIQGNFALTIVGKGFDSVIKSVKKSSKNLNLFKINKVNKVNKVNEITKAYKTDKTADRIDKIGKSNIINNVNDIENISIADGADNFLNSECVSCGACVKECPTAALTEKNLFESGKTFSKTRTTCAYCGVGCSFEVQYKGDNIIRMIPNEDSLSNYGHSCLKGRFAWSYVKSKDRLTVPLLRDNLNEEFKEVSWETAYSYIAKKFKEIQYKYGINSIGAISSSRCTNEENYLMQKMVRAAFQNNNIDTCARVCHQPTGYALGTAFGAGAGTQDLSSMFKSDLIMIIGANPTEAHPVVGAFIRKMARKGADLIVIDPRITEVAKSPHVKAKFHLRPKPGTNVALLNAFAYTIIKEGLLKQDFIKDRCDIESFNLWEDFILNDNNSPEAAEVITGVAAKEIKEAAMLYARAKNAAIFYGLGVTEHLQGSTGVLAIANLAMLTGNIGREGVGVSPLRGQNNVQGAADMGAEPATLPGYRHISDDNIRNLFENEWNVKINRDPGMRLPDMLRNALAGKFKGLYVFGEDIVQTDPDSNRIIESLKAMDLVVVHDLFKTVTSEYAHVILPGSSFLEKDGTFTNWERRIQRVRKVLEPAGGKQDWQIIEDLSRCLTEYGGKHKSNNFTDEDVSTKSAEVTAERDNKQTVLPADGDNNAGKYKSDYIHPSEIMDEIARLTPSFALVSYEKLNKKPYSVQWPCNENTPNGTDILHKDAFIGGKGRFVITSFIGSKDYTTAEYPFILTTVRNLFQYNSSNNTRRTENSAWYDEDYLEINEEDAKRLNINNGDILLIESKKGKITLTAKISGRVMKGIVATTFHFPEFKTNILTSDYSDWSTETPEYKVTAVNIKRIEKVNNVNNINNKAKDKIGKNYYNNSKNGKNNNNINKESSNDYKQTETYDDEVIRMFKDLIRIFGVYPEDIAVKEITAHIKKYWEQNLIERLVEINKNNNYNNELIYNIYYKKNEVNDFGSYCDENNDRNTKINNDKLNKLIEIVLEAIKNL